MSTNKPLLRIGAICSVLSALTTTILIYGPDASNAPDFDAVQQLHQNSMHLYKKWILFFHPQFAFIAALAAATILLKRSPALVGIGIFYLAVWAMTEMSQQAYLIDALNQMWRPAYLASTGADKELWRTMIMGLRGLSDSQYFVLLFGFGTGSILMGIAFLSEKPIERTIGLVTLSIGIASLLAFASYYAGLTAVSPLIGFWYTWLYGPIQIGLRLLTGLWLLQQVNAYQSETTNNSL
ncbi:hypothetical protein [Kordiimonas aquimaris]|uniref:hypothetical protein n=1 Tax=Kordiimonas aquimaris TaxID=707591 RepID=UPI0021D138FE|nr:hypothetical protein [Kordiimonas aquimaris]